METKKCFKCGKELPITEFYKHPMMPDGHLNKCKNCTKNDVRENYRKKSEMPEYMEKERQRGREKYQRLYSNLHIKKSHKENSTTRALAKRRGINCDGKEIHHWNYNESKSIFLLTRKEHKKVHQYLEFDKATNMFKSNGNLLDSKEKHLQIIKQVLGKEEVEEYILI